MQTIILWSIDLGIIRYFFAVMNQQCTKEKNGTKLSDTTQLLLQSSFFQQWQSFEKGNDSLGSFKFLEG